MSIIKSNYLFVHITYVKTKSGDLQCGEEPEITIGRLTQKDRKGADLGGASSETGLYYGWFFR